MLMGRVELSPLCSVLLSLTLSHLQVLKGMYDPLPETYSEELRSLITSMLNKEVKKRPTANDLLQVGVIIDVWQVTIDMLLC